MKWITLIICMIFIFKSNTVWSEATFIDEIPTSEETFYKEITCIISIDKSELVPPEPSDFLMIQQVNISIEAMNKHVQSLHENPVPIVVLGCARNTSPVELFPFFLRLEEIAKKHCGSGTDQESDQSIHQLIHQMPRDRQQECRQEISNQFVNMN